MPQALYLLVALLMSGTLAAQTFLDLDVQVAKDTIAANIDNPNFTILDVRTASEYLPEHIEGAFYRDFYAANFKEQLDSLSKSRVYLTYCRSGNRSGQTLQIMEDLGFETVYNMLGGMTAWNNAGFPVTEVIPDYVDIYETTSATDELEKLELQLFPNPVVNSLTISTAQDMGYGLRYNIVAQDGKKVASGLISPEETLDLSMLGSGLYTLVLMNGPTHLSTRYFVKQ